MQKHRKDHITTIVEKLLVDNAIDKAPVDIVRLAKNHGLQIIKQPAEEDLSGFLFRNKDNIATVIGVNSNQHPNRQRFTIAHELGHYLLHPTGGAADDMHVDRGGFSVKRRDTKSSEGVDEEEMEANLFAAEILMPRKFLARDIGASESVILDEDGVLLSRLAKQYKVSTQALAFRLAYLGYT